MGFAREAHKMLLGSYVPRLTHIIKAVPKDSASIQWMEDVDEAHILTLLLCVGAHTLESSMSACDREHLTASLVLPPQFGGVGLQSLIRAFEEDLLGSWTAHTSDLITFFRSKGVTIYSQLSNALNAMTDGSDNPSNE